MQVQSDTVRSNIYSIVARQSAGNPQTISQSQPRSCQTPIGSFVPLNRQISIDLFTRWTRFSSKARIARPPIPSALHQGQSNSAIRARHDKIAPHHSPTTGAESGRSTRFHGLCPAKTDLPQTHHRTGPPEDGQVRLQDRKLTYHPSSRAALESAFEISQGSTLALRGSRPELRYICRLIALRPIEPSLQG